MSPELIASKAQEMREKYPDMFTHSELQNDEAQIDDVLVDAASIQLHMYKTAGLHSARFGTVHLKNTGVSIIGDNGVLSPLNADLDFYPIFVSLEELILTEDKYEQEQLAKTPQPK